MSFFTTEDVKNLTVLVGHQKVVHRRNMLLQRAAHVGSHTVLKVKRCADEYVYRDPIRLPPVDADQMAARLHLEDLAVVTDWTFTATGCDRMVSCNPFYPKSKRCKGMAYLPRERSDDDGEKPPPQPPTDERPEAAFSFRTLNGQRYDACQPICYEAAAASTDNMIGLMSRFTFGKCRVYDPLMLAFYLDPTRRYMNQDTQILEEKSFVVNDVLIEPYGDAVLLANMPTDYCDQYAATREPDGRLQDIAMYKCGDHGLVWSTSWLIGDSLPKLSLLAYDKTLPYLTGTRDLSNEDEKRHPPSEPCLGSRETWLNNRDASKRTLSFPLRLSDLGIVRGTDTEWLVWTDEFSRLDDGRNDVYGGRLVERDRPIPTTVRDDAAAMFAADTLLHASVPRNRRVRRDAHEARVTDGSRVEREMLKSLSQGTAEYERVLKESLNEHGTGGRTAAALGLAGGLAYGIGYAYLSEKLELPSSFGVLKSAFTALRRSPVYARRAALKMVGFWAAKATVSHAVESVVTRSLVSRAKSLAFTHAIGPLALIIDVVSLIGMAIDITLVLLNALGVSTPISRRKNYVSDRKLYRLAQTEIEFNHRLYGKGSIELTPFQFAVNTPYLTPEENVESYLAIMPIVYAARELNSNGGRLRPDGGDVEFELDEYGDVRFLDKGIRQATVHDEDAVSSKVDEMLLPVHGSLATDYNEVLRDDFRSEPKDSRVAVGEKALLQCIPPKGTPEPIVHWKKNGEIINLEVFERMRIVDGGSLQISNVQVSDAGQYQCVARNLVGTRYSDVITLTVHRKPYLISEPRDVVTVAGESVEFECRVGGEPEPRILWRRDDGKMPVGRAHILDDRSLRIEQTQPADLGVYICDAENDVGSVSARAALTVHAPPEFLKQPSDQKVGVNAVGEFPCQVVGNPTPTVFWAREGSQELMLPGRTYGLASVDSEGTLRVTAVQRRQTGFYVCSAVSLAGSASTRVFLQVMLKEDIPPPLVEVGPANQTLPLHSSVSLPCRARGSPPPEIQWYKDGTPLDGTGTGSADVWINGTLHIQDLHLRDSGLYTCTATSESGESWWTAALTVDPQLESPDTVNSTLDIPATPPAPPSRPVVINTTVSTITVTWRPVNNSDGTPVTGYTVEYYSPDLQTGWVTVARGWNDTVIEVGDLRPDTTYMWVVRAEGAGGVSMASEPSEVSHSLSSQHDSVSPQRLALARARLAEEALLSLTHLQPMSSTAVSVHWQVHGSKEFLEGVYIRYRDLTNGAQGFHLAKLLRTDGTSHTLNKLRKFTRYEMFLVPFYKSVDGRPSNSLEVQTMEDVPSAPPEQLQVAWVNSSSAFVHWSPPHPQHCNGRLLGYELVVQDGSSLQERTLRLNSTAMSVLVNNLTQGHVYTASLKAYTRMGPGPAAQVRSVRGVDAFSTLPPQQMWMVVAAAATAIILVTAFAATFYLRKRNSLTKQIGHLSAVNASDLPHLGLIGGVKEALWIEVPHPHPSKHITLEGSDYAEVDTQTLSSFYNSRKDALPNPTPYATTILVPNTRQDSESETGPLIVPVSNSSSGTKTSTSGDSWLRHEQNKSTLEMRDDEKRCLQCSAVKESAVPNWNEFLPPPPQHPPPPRPQGSCGSPPMSRKSLGSCSHHSRDSFLGSAVYSQCWTTQQVPSFPSGYHTGSSNTSSFKCHQAVPLSHRQASHENTLCSVHHEHAHRHELNHCSCCCQLTERNNHKLIHTVSEGVGVRPWEEGSYSSSCCSEETASCTNRS